MFEELTHVLTLSRLPQTFLTNLSKLRIYLCKILTVITETLIVLIRLIPMHGYKASIPLYSSYYVLICRIYTRTLIILKDELRTQVRL
jgi:hypothetical protein